MKRFIAVLSSLLVLPAFAEVAPSYYEDVIEYTDEMDDDDEVVQDEVKTAVETKQNVVQRTNINRSTAVSRAKTSANTGTSRTNTASRAIASSKGGATTARTTTARTAKTANVVSRPRVATASRTSAATRNTQTTKPVVARVGTGQMSVMPGTKNSTLGVNTLTDSGKPLYNRVGVSSRRSNTRLASTSAVTTPVVTQEDVSTTAENMNALAELTDYCKAQYAACMDNYCNVLDDNQGRCSCSKNLKNYAKTEETLAQANEEFQEVVQKIRYIGLTGQQIESLFAETEAELTMKSTTDKSNLQSSLNNLKKKIIDVSSPTATSASAVNDLSLDATGLFNIDFTSGFDLSSFLGITGVTSASSVSNQRGEQLYKTATNRCKANVLNSCVAQGIDANVITNSYDLEIDKQCVEYERSLNEANQELRNYVLNASNILKQARLMLAQNRNAYNLRECVAAIDTCMQDDYVCGSDYEKCLDPTGKYLANGEIVKGGTPGVAGGQTVNSSPIVASTATYSSANANPPTITTAELNDWTSGGMYNLYATWNYDGTNNNKLNAWSIGGTENLGDYIDASLDTWEDEYDNSKSTMKTDNMALYLLQKIGYIDKEDKAHGMCASVMKQCQDYTFETKKNNKSYIPDNEVVRQYLNNTLAAIKVKQDEILSDYAESCRSDVQSCLSTNGYDETNPKSTASKTAVNSCSAEITTCMSVGGYQVNSGVRLTLSAMTDWVTGMFVSCPINHYLYDDESDSTNTIECLPCPYARKVEWTVVTGNICKLKAVVGSNQQTLYSETTSNGGQVTQCSCPSGQTAHIVESGDTELLNADHSNIGKELVCITNARSDCPPTTSAN